MRRRITVLLFSIAALRAPRAMAQDSDIRREAAKHFQRGVSLYGEADYRGALVEFKRAAGLVQNPAVLYNIGETEYQLQEYASALTTFGRYLAESGAADAHRAEVEANVQALKARVGHIAITTFPTGAEITVDDVPVGRTPLDRPVLVSIGHRKIMAALPGRPQETKYADVAAEDVVSVTLALAVPAAATPVPQPASPRALAPHDAPDQTRGSGLRAAGWVATGALAVVAGSFGWLALKESSDLKAARSTYPTDGAALDHAGKLTMTYSVLADSLAAAALVVGGVTLYSTLSSSSGSASPQASAGVTLGPRFVHFEARF